MGFFKNLFGGNEEKGNKRTPIEHIEQQLNVQFPGRFKQFTKEKLPRENSIKIELLDGSYKFLDSIFKDGVSDHDEMVVNISEELNSSYYPEDKDFVKIPFAKSTEGDGYKYLYFIAKQGKEASEKIFLVDIDSPDTGRISLCNQLPFIIRNIGRVDNYTLVTNTSLNFSEANSWIEIPTFINLWKDSFGLTIRDEVKDEHCKVEMYLVNYSMDDKDENFSKIEVQLDIAHNNKRILSAQAFEVDKAGLQYQFANNINYRIFYHKLVCIIGTLAITAADLKTITTLK